MLRLSGAKRGDQPVFPQSRRRPPRHTGRTGSACGWSAEVSSAAATESDGELETLKPDDWLALRERMRAVRRAGAGQDTPYLRILRRFVPE